MNFRTQKKVKIFLIYVFLIIFCLIAVLPISWVWLSSFKTNREISFSPFVLPKQIRWQNYIEAWQEGNFSTCMWNSAVVAFITTLFVVILSSLAAYAFAKMRFKANNLLFFIFFFGMTVPNPAVMGPLLSLVYKLRLTNTLWSLIFPYTASHLSFGILMMRAFFREIPTELEEAAKIDGCSSVQLLFLIILPLALPAIFVLTVLIFMGCWNEFYFAVILINDASKNTLPLGLRAFEGQYATNYALQFTGINIAAIVPIVMYIIFQKSFVKGAIAGSLKG